MAYGFISNLAKSGHRIHVAAEYVALENPLPPNVTIHFIKIKSKHPVLKRVEYSLRVRALFERLSRSIRFDIIHQLNPVHAGLSLGMVGTSVPIVLGNFIPRWPDDADQLTARPPSLQSRMRDFAIAPLLLAQQLIAKGLLVVSPAALERFPLRRCFTSRTYEVHHGIDTASLFPAPANAKDASDTILFLANLGARKGMYTLLDAFESVAERRPRARLLIAGSGWEEAALLERIAHMRARDNVTFLGRVSREDVPDIMSRAAVYCLPSYGEPYGMSVMEAMACGKAIVATNIGGPRYMVPADGGTLVPARNAFALADALVALLADPSTAEAMGRVNRASVESQYAWDKVVERLESVYRRVIGVR